MAAFTKSGHTKTFRFAGLTGCFRPEADLRLLRFIIVNQLEAFTDEHHFAAEAAVPLKVPLMIASPSL